METIEQTLDNWLEEYSANKNLRNRLAGTTKENPKGIIPDTAMISLSKKEIEVLVKGLDTVLQSNKESIIDCSYNFVQTRKNKNNIEQISNTDENKIETKDENKIETKDEKTTIIHTTKKFDDCFESILNSSKDNIIIIFNTSLNQIKEKIYLICLIKDITGISLNEAKEVFNNRNKKEKQFTLSVERCIKNASRLRDYIACNGTIKILS